ncbi:hypothetical protein ACFQX6_42605 [Streptosporangium lutulentum]
MFVKPSRGGSALGASIVRVAEELPAAMVGCFAYGDTALIERCIKGVEVSVSVVDLGEGPVALPPWRSFPTTAPTTTRPATPPVTPSSSPRPAFLPRSPPPVPKWP